MNQLNKAIMIAADAHDGQVDKNGDPYILHPIRVMARGKTEVEMIVGVLHDVCEDTHVEIGYIMHTFGKRISLAVEALTRGENEVYSEFIIRVDCSELATAVKLNDLYDNLDPSRASGLTPKLKERYERAVIALGGKL